MNRLEMLIKFCEIKNDPDRPGSRLHSLIKVCEVKTGVSSYDQLDREVPYD